jgi:hypothetical protein
MFRPVDLYRTVKLTFRGTVHVYWTGLLALGWGACSSFFLSGTMKANTHTRALGGFWTRYQAKRDLRELASIDTVSSFTRVYPEVSGLASESENYKW